MFRNVINLVSFMINLLECLVLNSCSVTVLDHILINIEKIGYHVVETAIALQM